MIERAPRVQRDDADDRERPPARDADSQPSVPVPIRTKLVVGGANDPAEREADVMADEVMRRLQDGGAGGDGGPRQATGPGRVMRSTAAGAIVGLDGGAVDADLDRDIRSATGNGAPGSDAVLRRMGDAFGTDLGDVSIHTGGSVDRAAAQMQARAFAIGKDVYVRRSDYRPGTSDGDRLLAHELAHTMQGGSGAVNRTVIRRLLVPKVDGAFTEALAANPGPYFTKGRSDTDRFVNKTDQEALARVHGRGHVGKDSADKEKVANMVRAVVLSNYAERLQNLEEGVDRETGAPYKQADKPKKRAVYKAKAEEFRQKTIPLVAKGSTAPETQAFLREYGVDGVFGDLRAAAVKKNKGVQPARIEVRSTFIGGPILGVKLRAHLFIVYTGTDGRQLYFRGGPDRQMFTVADTGDYTPGTVDWDPSAPTVTLMEGPEAERKLDALIEATSVIDAMKVPYQAAIGKEYGGAKPNKAQKLLSTASAYTSGDGENCNATAWTILTRAGIKPKKPGGVHPGWGKALGTHTKDADKRPMAAPEQFGAGTPYTLDASREQTLKNGTIQVYRDRMLHQQLYKVAPGTSVQLLDTLPGGVLRIMLNGELGYVVRTGADLMLDYLPDWIRGMRADYTVDELQEMVAGDDPLIEDASERLGIPEQWVGRVAGLTLSGQDTTTVLLQERLAAMGEARLDELLTNPDEAARIAAATGYSVTDVMDTIQSFVGAKKLVAQVPGALKRALDDPNAANTAVNEYPNYDVIKDVATDLGADPNWVYQQIDAMRPAEHQGKYFETLLSADPIALSELPNVAGYMLKAWAQECGVTVEFLKQQCGLVHAARVEAKRIADEEAEAQRKAREEAAKKESAKQQAPPKPKAPKPVAVKEPRLEQWLVSQIMMGPLFDVLGETRTADTLTDEEAQGIAKQYESDGVTVEDVHDIARKYFKKA